MGKRKTTDQFKQSVFEQVGDEYLVLGEYVKSSHKILIRHQNCHHEYEVVPNNFLRGSRCPRCSRKSKKTTEHFKQRVFELTKQDYQVLGEYTGALDKIEMKHQICGHVYFVTPANFLSGYRCPKCACKARKTTEDFKQRVFALTGGDYQVLGEYVKASHKLLMEHQVCGHRYEVSPSTFLSGYRCPRCSKNAKKTTDDFKQRVFTLTGEEYQVLGNYINVMTKIQIKHQSCGHIYEVRPNNFYKGSRCPKCSRKGPKPKSISTP